MNPIPAFLFFVGFAALLASPPAPLQDDDAHDHKEDRHFDFVWSLPETTGHAAVVYANTVNMVDSLIERFGCAAADRKCPMSREQEARLRAAGLRACERLISKHKADFLIAGIFEEARTTRHRQRSSFEYAGLAELRLECRAGKGIAALHRALDERIAEEWRAVATKAQWEATQEILYDAKSGLLSQATAERQARFFQRQLEGQLSDDDLKMWKVDPDGPREVTAATLPERSPWESEWNYLVVRFAHRHRLTPEQQAAAKAILDDCVKRARALRQRDDPEVQRLWKQLLTAYLDPKASKAPLKEALRQYRRVSQEAVRPIYEEMQRRLEAILTTEQKRRAGPPPPQPEWMRLMEIALADDEESPPANSQPITQPTTTPTAPPTTQRSPPPTSQPSGPFCGRREATRRPRPYAHRISPVS